MTSERALTDRILRHLRALPRSWWFKVKGGSGQQAGIPDIVGCIGGRFVAIEVKRPGKRPTKLQGHVMGLIREAGGAVGVARSVEDADRIASEPERLAERAS